MHKTKISIAIARMKKITAKMNTFTCFVWTYSGVGGVAITFYLFFFGNCIV